MQILYFRATQLTHHRAIGGERACELNPYPLQAGSTIYIYLQTFFYEVAKAFSESGKKCSKFETKMILDLLQSYISQVL